MRVYYIANARMPSERAHGIQIAKMCEAFIESGMDLVLVTPRRRGSSDSIRSFYGLRTDIPVRRLRILDTYHFGKFGYRIASLSFALASLAFIIRKRLSGERFVAYTIDMDQFTFLSVGLAGVPYFFESHGIKRPSFVNRLFVRRAKGIIVINEYIRQHFIRSFRIDSARVMARSNGIDPSDYADVPDKEAARSALGVGGSGHILVYIGKIYSWKGLGVLVAAARSLPESVRIYVVGGSSEELARITGFGDIPTNLVCVGQRPYAEVPLWLGAADALLLVGTASNEYSYRQTSPMKLFEYLVAKRPIIAGETPAVREVVSEREVYYYEPDNPEDFIRSVLEALHGDPVIRSERIERAYRVGREHTWHDRARIVISFALGRMSL